MIRWNVWIVVVCALLSVSLTNPSNAADEPLTSEEIDLSQPLTLQQCIQLALENSSDMRNARIDLVIQDLRVKNARARYYPEIFIDGRYHFSEEIDFGFERENDDLGVTGRYTLWDNGQREASFSQAKQGQTATANRNEQIKQNLIFDVTQAYYNILKAQELVKVDKEIVARSRENTDRVRAFVEAGVQIPADVATAQVLESTDQLTLLNDQNELQIAMATLPRIMGLDPGTLITVAEDTAYQLYRQKGEVEIIDISIEEAIQRAFENRPEFREIQARIKQLEWDLTLAKLERWPRLNAASNYSVELDDYLREREDFKEFRRWDVTATLEFSIFDGGVRKRHVQEAELNLEQAREDASDLERSIALAVRQGYLNLKRVERALEISDTQVRDAQLSLEVTRGRYEQELVILLDLLQVQTAFARVLTNQVRTFYDSKVTQGALQRAMGVLQ
ncbi:MAG: TolC family protein [Candidatus Poribacteria bacterium]|nr:TolC family protein [Candidatus Poribacteria bacterium]